MSQVRQSTFTPCIPARIAVLDQDDAPEEDAAGVARDGVVLDSHRLFATYSTLNKVIQRKSAKSELFSSRRSVSYSNPLARLKFYSAMTWKLRVNF